MRKIMVLLIVLIPAIMAALAWSPIRAVRDSKGVITEQSATRDSLRAELRGIDAEAKKAVEEMSALPKEAQMRHAIRTGERLAKREAHIAGLITRAGNRIRNAEARNSAARQDLVRRTVPLAALWVVLVVALSWVSSRRDTSSAGAPGTAR